MSKKTLYILLLISLAFNLSFVGSYIFWNCRYNKHFSSKQSCDMKDCPPPPPPVERGMGMGPQMNGHPYMMGNREEMRPYVEAFQNKRKEFFEALQQPKVDEALLKQKLEASLEAHNAQEKAIGLKLIALRKTMSAEEAKSFFGNRIDRMEHRRFRNMPRREK